MRRVIVWRHGQTEHNAGGILQGQLDTHLSGRGHEQARAAAQVLADRSPVRLLASDLRRAHETAGELATVTGLGVEPEPRLREIHVGAWQGLRHAEVVAGWPDAQAALARGEDVPRGETGERVSDVAARMRQVFDEVVAVLSEGETVVLASHGFASRALVTDVLGLDFAVASQALVGLHNCHWAELVEHQSGWRLEAWNAGLDVVPARG